MTTVYFIRHAESDYGVRDAHSRPLTAKGMADRALVTNFLSDKNVDIVCSSPYVRAVDTVSDFADKYGFKLNIIDDFKERVSDSDRDLDGDFIAFMRKQWGDFNYTLSDGERLFDVQRRNIAALNGVLLQNENKTVAIGTHGTALSTIINHYDGSYGFQDFMAMVNIMPWVVRMTFDGLACVKIEKINLFEKVTIRLMTARDYDGAYELWLNTAGMGLNDIDDSREGITKYLNRNPDSCFVAEKAGKIIGVILCGHDGRRGFIYHMAVAECERAKGIGTSLLDKAVSALKSINITKVALVVKDYNECGNKFWERKGFAARSDLVYRDYSLIEVKRNDIK